MTRAAILFVALALLAWLSGWVADLVTPRPVAEKPPRHVPDFYLTGVEGWSMDDQGRLQHHLTAERILHYGDDGSVELERPRFFIHDGQQTRWEIRGEAGHSDAAGELVRLQGEVHMERTSGKSAALYTRDLLFRPRQSYVETDAAVHFVEAAGEVHATGLRGYLGEAGRLELLSEVRGTYEP
ncbi:MAG: hypothetical protein Kow006_01020 [Gammaproteobacteria bacterium]